MSPFATLIIAASVILMVLTIAGAVKARKKIGYKGVAMYLFIFSILFTASSLFWTTDIAYDTRTITHLEFGWPIPFEMQNQSFFDPPFPYQARADFSGHSIGTVFVWKNFLFSIAINFALVVTVWRIATPVIFKRRS